jgi:hypothetical protein
LTDWTYAPETAKNWNLNVPTRLRRLKYFPYHDPRLFVTFTIKTARKERYLYVPAPMHQSLGK